jgi:methionyl-tRNA formyltransferase
LKIAYFGLPLGALLLRHDGHELGPIVLSPVDAPGRRRLARLVPRWLDAADASVDFDAEVLAALDDERPDLLVSWFWTRKLPVAWLEHPPLGAIGAHPSLLPRHRGPNPYFWSIDAGDPEVGVTIHRLREEYDTGDMLAWRSLPSGSRDAWQLARALDRPSLALLRETTLRLARGEAVPAIRQDERGATWAPEPSGEALKVDFGWATERVLRRIRALSPTTGVALAVLDAGAEDVNDLGESFEVISEPTDLVAVRTALQDAGIDYESAEASFQPSVSVPVDVDGARKVFKLVDALEDSDDVQNVWTNVDLSDEVLAALDDE